MNIYTNIISKALDYIEENISQNLTVKDVAGRFYLSEFHFSRLFKIITGISLKQYILGRKLTLSFNELKNSPKPVIDIAYDYGFNYPEVFSRAFKKHFGLSPFDLRNNNNISANEKSIIDKAYIIERDIANYHGTLTIKETYIYLEEIFLSGCSIVVDENSDEFNEDLTAAGEQFILNTKDIKFLKQDKFYALVKCFGDDSGKYTVFYGKETIYDYDDKMEKRSIPKGWYARFTYTGRLTDNRLTFVDDFYRWIMVKEIELEDNGIGMLNIFNPVALEDIQFLIPVKSPK